MTSHREREHAYDPPADVELPDLTGLEGVDAVEARPAVELEATYYDTVDLDLAAHRVTLRRRTGGSDEGWHLKLPLGDGEREEIRLPLARSRKLPPKAHRDLVLALTRGAPLVPVATIRTCRTEIVLQSAGRVLAEVADDRVDAHRSLPGDEPRLMSWREWEVELVEGAPALLEAADDLMADHDVPIAAHGTKLGRVLGDAWPPALDLERPRPGKPVARVLHAYLAAQLDQLLTADRAVRRREPEGIHDLRVALRRMRTTLATYRSLVDRAVTDPLRDEMRWVSHALGSARDTEVVQERLEELLARESREMDPRSARNVLADASAGNAREAHRTADETLRSERYLGVIDQLHQLVADPPWTDVAGRKARKTLPTLLAKDLQRVRRRARQVKEADSPGERSGQLHEVRKAAKRLRYACEAAGAATDASELEGAAKKIQTVLGDHHDTVLTRARLLEHADDPSGAAFTLGRLHALEEAESVRLEHVFAEAWDELESGAGKSL